MIDYRIIKFNNGDSIFCIVEHETDDIITVVFPMLLKEHTFVLGPNSVRETYSASQFCPFSDEKTFSFYKPELLFIKPLNSDAIPYYIGILNKNETSEMLKKYNLSELITNDNDDKVIDMQDMEKEIAEIAERLGVVLEDSEEEEPKKTVVNGNKTVH